MSTAVEIAEDLRPIAMLEVSDSPDLASKLERIAKCIDEVCRLLFCSQM